MDISLDLERRSRQSLTMRYLLILLCLLAVPASADEFCEDLWFTRNQVFDRAGFCFGSPLGDAVFDNSDCTGRDVTLSQSEKRFVAELRTVEEQQGCMIETDAVQLKLSGVALRRQLRDLPFRDLYESGCLGWKDATRGLYAGHDTETETIGQIEPGDFILYSHQSVGTWNFVTIYGPVWQGFKSAGWLDGATMSDASCEDWAG